MLGRHAPVAMALGVVAGLFLPWLSARLGPAVTPAVWLLLVLAMLRVDWSALAHHVRRPMALAALVLWMLLLTPVLMYAVATALGLPPALVIATVLAAGSSPLMSTPAVGLILGLDAALLLAALIVETLLIPFTVPLVTGSLLGLDLALDTQTLMARLGLLVASAVAVGAALRGLLGRERLVRHGPRLDGAAVVLLVLFAVAIMDGVLARIVAEPARILGIVALSFAVYVGLQAVGSLVWSVATRGRDRRLALSAGFATGNRNLAVFLAVLPDGTNPDVMIYFALGQFPIYMMPMILRPICRRLLGDAREREPRG